MSQNNVTHFFLLEWGGNRKKFVSLQIENKYIGLLLSVERQ